MDRESGIKGGDREWSYKMKGQKWKVERKGGVRKWTQKVEWESEEKK